jgi:hypothetical protein
MDQDFQIPAVIFNHKRHENPRKSLFGPLF